MRRGVLFPWGRLHLLMGDNFCMYLCFVHSKKTKLFLQTLRHYPLVCHNTSCVSQTVTTSWPLWNYLHTSVRSSSEGVIEISTICFRPFFLCNILIISTLLCSINPAFAVLMSRFGHCPMPCSLSNQKSVIKKKKKKN